MRSNNRGYERIKHSIPEKEKLRLEIDSLTSSRES